MSASSSEVLTSVIIDVGSAKTKAGLSTEDAPWTIFSSCVGVPRQVGDLALLSGNLIGEEAIAKVPLVTLKYPVDYGYVANWELYQDILTNIYDKRLCIPSEDHPVVLVEPVLNPALNREKVAQIMLEEFEVPALYLGSQSALSVHSAGILGTTGMMIETGDGVMHPVPIYEGCFLRSCVLRAETAGGHIPHDFRKHASTPDRIFTTTAEFRMLKKHMERLAIVSQDYTADESRSASDFAVPISLDDGSEFIIDRARYRCTEPIFQPPLGGFEMPGVPYMVWNTLLKCDPSIRAELLHNIVLCGGYASLPGFAERMEAEVKALAGNCDYTIKVRAHPHPTYAAWSGAQKLASNPEFWKNGMSRQEYDESGPTLATRKFVCT